MVNHATMSSTWVARLQGPHESSWANTWQRWTLVSQDHCYGFRSLQFRLPFLWLFRICIIVIPCKIDILFANMGARDGWLVVGYGTQLATCAACHIQNPYSVIALRFVVVLSVANRFACSVYPCSSGLLHRHWLTPPPRLWTVPIILK